MLFAGYCFWFFVEQLVEMIIDNERLSIISIAFRREIINIPKQHIIVLCIRCFDSCYMWGS